ncbi:MAG: DUF6152 family protein [Alphaproteobacteria bacterium]
MSLRRVVLAAILAVICPAGAFAHHAFEAEFDTTAPVTLKGTVSAVDWVNPHSTITLNVAEPGKAPQAWKILSGSPQALNHRGVCRLTLPVGSDVTVTAYLARDKNCLRSEGGTHPVCLVAGRYLTFPATQSLIDIYSSGSFSVYAPEQTQCRRQGD